MNIIIYFWGENLGHLRSIGHLLNGAPIMKSSRPMTVYHVGHSCHIALPQECTSSLIHPICRASICLYVSIIRAIHPFVCPSINHSIIHHPFIHQPPICHSSVIHSAIIMSVHPFTMHHNMSIYVPSISLSN